MSFSDYIDQQDWLGTYFDERYWEGGLDTDACYEMILEMAAKEGVSIEDAETVDFDEMLSEAYHATEKGLS